MRNSNLDNFDEGINLHAYITEEDTDFPETADVACLQVVSLDQWPPGNCPTDQQVTNLSSSPPPSPPLQPCEEHPEMEDSEERAPLLTRKTVVPRDRCYLVYCIFYILGVGSLLPWNFFSNARQYFVFKMRDDTNVTDHEWVDDPTKYNHYQAMFVPYLSMAAMIPNVLFMFLNTAVTKLMSLKIRIVIATGAMIVMFALTIIITKLNTDSWRIQFFAVTMVTIVVMNAGSAVLQGGVFGLSGMFPKEYTQSVMGGMGMGGVIAASANILAIWLSTGPMNSGFGYFLTGEMVVIFALVGYLSLPCLKFARHYIEDKPTYTSPLNSDSSEEGGHVEIRQPHSSLCEVFQKLWVYALSVFVIFLVTLSCYPAVNSRIFSMQKNDQQPSQWAEKYFIPVTCFLLFNVWDLIGRTLAGLIQWPREGSMVLPVLCIARVAFIPVFLYCNILPRHHLSTFFKNDYVPIITMVLFGLSNGYLGTLCMMYGPRLVDPWDIETAGAMMSFFLSLGLATGSAFSFLLITLA